MCLPCASDQLLLDHPTTGRFCVVYQKVGLADDYRGDDRVWITERRKIARRYLLGWFPLDLLSIIPSVFDIVPFVIVAQSGATDAWEAQKRVKPGQTPWHREWLGFAVRTSAHACSSSQRVSATRGGAVLWLRTCI